MQAYCFIIMTLSKCKSGKFDKWMKLVMLKISWKECMCSNRKHNSSWWNLSQELENVTVQTESRQKCNLLYPNPLLGHTPDIKRTSFSSLNMSTLYKPEAEQLISDIHHHRGWAERPAFENGKNRVVWEKWESNEHFACG